MGRMEPMAEEGMGTLGASTDRVRKLGEALWLFALARRDLRVQEGEAARDADGDRQLVCTPLEWAVRQRCERGAEVAACAELHQCGSIDSPLLHGLEHMFLYPGEP